VHTRATLVQDLRQLGLKPGDVIMAHASLRAIGEVAGGPDEVHLAIKDVITGEGTLFMYAGCPRYFDEIGRGNLTPDEEREVFDKLPVFDSTSARSARDNGALVELFRTWPGSRVNDHVARFVAWGKHTDYLFSEQPWDFAFGRGSVLERFTELNGKILLLGSDHDNVTFLHYPEHIGDFSDKRIVHFKVPVLEDGNRVWREMAEVDTSVKAHENWPDGFFAQIVGEFLDRSGNKGGRVGDAHSFLIPAQGLLEHALQEMQSVAGNTGQTAVSKQGK
jgi:aminoglycoside 3-N-acetyltransferase